MVEFVVRVPEFTPPDRPVFLAGDGPALGDWSAHAVRLDRWDDGTHRTQLDLPQGFRSRFLVTLGRWRSAETDADGRERPPRELHVDGSVVETDVAGWGRESVRYHHDFASRFLPHARGLCVWLPPGYELEPTRRYPVLYLHDGQNLFDPETAFAGNPWWADEVAEREVRAGRAEPLLIVGVANTPDRLDEYGPRRGGEQADDRSRGYGRFLVEEVKPFIDANYRTLPDAANTGVGGSSMGGLISLHLCKWYPGVFGKCAAMSPALWWDREYFLQNVSASPEWMKSCRVWLDMGTREGASDTAMEAMVRRARRLARHLERRGMGGRLRLEVVENGLHNEAAWGRRLDRVLGFLFRPEPR
jgi:predicted alpha/beta superfamily hydrolase